MSERSPYRSSDEIMAVVQAQVIVLEPMLEGYEFSWSHRGEITPDEALSLAQTSLRIKITYNQHLSELSILTNCTENLGKIYEEQMKLNYMLEQSKEGNNQFLVGYMSHRSDERFIASLKARGSGNSEQADKLIKVSDTLKQVGNLLP